MTVEAHVLPPVVASARLVEAALDAVAATFGFEIVLVELAGGPGARVVRIYIDRVSDPGAPGDAGPGQGGVTIGDCARLSRMFSHALDAFEAAFTGVDGAEDDAGSEGVEDLGAPTIELDPERAAALHRLIAGAYTLEVSSPGIDRPLARRAHYERHLGRRVELRTHEPVAPGSRQRTFHARLEAVDADPSRPAEDPYAAIVTIRELEGGAVHRIPLTLVKRANAVYEG